MYQCANNSHGTCLMFLFGLILFAVTVSSIQAQEKLPASLDQSNVAIKLLSQPQTQAPNSKRTISLAEAVEIFLRQNLQLVAARYDIETADAEKLTARLRPNPQLTAGLSDLPVNFSGPLIKEQTYNYGISRTIELGGKRIRGGSEKPEPPRFVYVVQPQR